MPRKDAANKTPRVRPLNAARSIYRSGRERTLAIGKNLRLAASESWQEYLRSGPLLRTRDGFQLLFFVLSIVGILAAGDIFLIHRRSQLELAIEATRTTSREIVETAVRAQGLATDVIPSVPLVSIRGKESFPSSFTAWSKLAPKQADAESLRAPFDKMLESPEVATVPSTIRSNPWLAALYLRAKKASDQITADRLIDVVLTQATSYTVIVEVSNKGDGDSGPVSVDIPSQASADNQGGRWAVSNRKASLEQLKPDETARLVLTADRPLDFDDRAVRLVNSSGVFAENFGLIALLAFLFTAAVFVGDLVVASKRSPTTMRA